MLPFYFLIDLPEGADEGFMVLQRTGMYGIRKMLSEFLTQEFEVSFTDYQLHLHPLVESAEIKKYQKGKIESIRLINFKIPSDIADAFDSGHRETKGTVELVIRARRGGSLPIGDKLRQFFSGTRQLGKFIALDETHFPYQNVKVKSRVGGTTRTVDLAHLNHLRSYHDITDRVVLDNKSGHPKFESINKLADDLVARIKSEIGLGDG
jgi:hypothetical protein